MENMNIVDLYSLILDYNALFYREVDIMYPELKEKCAVLLMGLFNYIMECNDSDLRMEVPEDTVSSKPINSRYYKMVDDKKVIRDLADYTALYIPEVEEDLAFYQITKHEGVQVYTAYLNTLADTYGMHERYTDMKMQELYEELNALQLSKERSYYH